MLDISDLNEGDVIENGPLTAAVTSEPILLTVTSVTKSPDSVCCQMDVTFFGAALCTVQAYSTKGVLSWITL